MNSLRGVEDRELRRRQRELKGEIKLALRELRMATNKLNALEVERDRLDTEMYHRASDRFMALTPEEQHQEIERRSQLIRVALAELRSREHAG